MQSVNYKFYRKNGKTYFPSQDAEGITGYGKTLEDCMYSAVGQFSVKGDVGDYLCVSDNRFAPAHTFSIKEGTKPKRIGLPAYKEEPLTADALSDRLLCAAMTSCCIDKMECETARNVVFPLLTGTPVKQSSMDAYNKEYSKEGILDCNASEMLGRLVAEVKIHLIRNAITEYESHLSDMEFAKAMTLAYDGDGLSGSSFAIMKNAVSAYMVAGEQYVKDSYNGVFIALHVSMETLQNIINIMKEGE